MKRTIDIGYLVVGLVFLGLSGSWALGTAGVVDTERMQWLFPVTLLGAGLIGLLVSLARGMTRRRDTPPPPYVDDEPVTDLTTDLERELDRQQTTGEQP